MKRSSAFLFSLCILLAASGLMADSCRKQTAIPSPEYIQQSVPAGFPPPVYTFENNPLTKQGFELGRKLFYDGRLSKDGNFPCASCHQQFAAFANFDHNLSHGFNNAFTTRNAPALFNLAWQKEFNLDGGVNHIEVQPLGPLTAPNEMAETIENVIGKVKADPEYRKMFLAAFGTEEINSQRLLKALAQFTVSLVSAEAKYDRYKKGQETFTPYEARGYELFKAKCSHCHPEPMFTDYSYRNIGLPVYFTTIDDPGRMRITGNRGDSLKFKVPSLRNVALTEPYMHDGRFKSMESCLQHYSSGIIQNAALDPFLSDGIPLSPRDIVDITAFLRTLTDTSFTKNPLYADPENKPIISPDQH